MRPFIQFVITRGKLYFIIFNTTHPNQHCIAFDCIGLIYLNKMSCKFLFSHWGAELCQMIISAVLQPRTTNLGSLNTIAIIWLTHFCWCQLSCRQIIQYNDSYCNLAELWSHYVLGWRWVRTSRYFMWNINSLFGKTMIYFIHILRFTKYIQCFCLDCDYPFCLVIDRFLIRLTKIHNLLNFLDVRT